MATKLTDITCHEISLCDYPAVRTAKIAIAKRDEATAPAVVDSLEQSGMNLLRQIGKSMFPDDSPEVQFAKACETPEGAKTYAIMKGYAIPPSRHGKAGAALEAMARHESTRTGKPFGDAYATVAAKNPELMRQVRDEEALR
ncbi:MAG: hypothetical protein WCO00_08835 [Rhodospirillaceae bacterium]